MRAIATDMLGRSVVCLFCICAGRDRNPCKNGQTDRDAFYRADSRWLTKLHIDWYYRVRGAESPNEKDTTGSMYPTPFRQRMHPVFAPDERNHNDYVCRVGS